jgi:hypothetical protein
MKDEIKLHSTDFIPDAIIYEEQKQNSSISTKTKPLFSNNPAFYEAGIPTSSPAGFFRHPVAPAGCGRVKNSAGSSPLFDAGIPQSQFPFLQLGTNAHFNRYIRNCKEQSKFPYYWVDQDNAVYCHCPGNPKAKWIEDRGWFKCVRRSKAEGKCCLFIPARHLLK